MKKQLLIILLLAALSFASPPTIAWLNATSIAVVISAIVLALIYGIGTGFQMNDLKYLAGEEAYQLVATIVLIAILFGAESYINSLSTAMGFEGTIQQASANILTSTMQNHSAIFYNLTDFSLSLGRESTKSATCSLQDIGFTIAPCGAFSGLAPIAQTSLQAISLSTAEVQSLMTLNSLGIFYAFSLFLPIGILLRTFRFTRGAGGLLIALAVSLYLMLPLSVVFMDVVTASSTPHPLSSISGFSCDLSKFASADGSFDYSNYYTAKSALDSLNSNLDNYLYVFFIQSTLTLLVALSVFFISFKWMAKAAGSDVEISALMRVS